MKIIALTVGDPAGIGPEITAKVLRIFNVADTSADLRFIVFGREIDLKNLLLADFPLSWYENVSEAVKHIKNQKFVGVDITNQCKIAGEIKPGVQSAISGEIAYKTFQTAVKFAMSKPEVRIVTAPISKKALNLAGYNFTGHTSILKAETGITPVMSFYVPSHKLPGKSCLVSLVTKHIPYLDVPKQLAYENIKYVVEITDAAVKKYFKVAKPRIAVCALNPHASEDGLFGIEEEELLLPVIKKLMEKGFDVTPPLPADTVFHRTFNKGEFDAVISLYHDQGLIAVKTFDFQAGVQLSLGLPFLRLSVDHGTAFDIAGKNQADETSLMQAVKLATRL